jgi:hypothetical protein
MLHSSIDMDRKDSISSVGTTTETNSNKDSGYTSTTRTMPEEDNLESPDSETFHENQGTKMLPNLRVSKCAPAKYANAVQPTQTASGINQRWWSG